MTSEQQIQIESARDLVQEIQSNLRRLNSQLLQLHQSPEKYEINLNRLEDLRDMTSDFDELFTNAAMRQPELNQRGEVVSIIPDGRGYATMMVAIIEGAENPEARAWAKGEITRIFQHAMGEMAEANPYDGYIS